MSATPIPEQLSADFESLEHARNAIRAFVIEQGESYLVTHSNTSRHIVACRDTAAAVLQLTRTSEQHILLHFLQSETELLLLIIERSYPTRFKVLNKFNMEILLLAISRPGGRKKLYGKSLKEMKRRVFKSFRV
ncbi:MAG: hypothetical protein M1839_005688 [Geoglossum umbratile]|nr:MAG: hypothetical protein M1839_005688 [Geoglossum umbratile]